MKQHHVVPNKNGGWDIKLAKCKDVIGHYKTKKEAIREAREISREAKTELKIHNKDGKIAESDSHGNDPIPPRG